MDDVKRYGHISYLVEAIPAIVELYPSMTIYTLASDFDAQRLRADTAEAENRILRHSNASFLETVAKVCNLLGIDLDEAKDADGQPSDVLFAHAKAQADKLAAAEQRIVDLQVLLRLMTKDYACCLEAGYDRITFLGGDCDSVSKMLADNVNYAKACSALNPKPEAESHEKH